MLFHQPAATTQSLAYNEYGKRLISLLVFQTTMFYKKTLIFFHRPQTRNKNNKIIAIVTPSKKNRGMTLMKKEFKEGNITITVDYDKCQGSGECVTACPVEIFELVDGKAVAKK